MRPFTPHSLDRNCALPKYLKIFWFERRGFGGTRQVRNSSGQGDIPRCVISLSAPGVVARAVRFCRRIGARTNADRCRLHPDRPVWIQARSWFGCLREGILIAKRELNRRNALETTSANFKPGIIWLFWPMKVPKERHPQRFRLGVRRSKRRMRCRIAIFPRFLAVLKSSQEPSDRCRPR